MKLLSALTILCLLLLFSQPALAYSEKIAALNEAINSSTSLQELARYHLYRSRAYQQVGKEQQALADLEQAVSLRPCATIHYEKARYLRRLDKDQEALKAIDHALACNKHYLPALQLRSELFFEQKDYSMAILDASTILHIEPHNGAARSMVDHCWIAASPRERITIRSNPDVIQQILQYKKKQGSTRRLVAKASPRRSSTAKKVRAKRKVKKSSCGPTRRRS